MEKLVIPAGLLLETIDCLPSLRTLVLVDLEFTLPPGKLADVEILYVGQVYKHVDLSKTLACFHQIKELHIITPFLPVPQSVHPKLLHELSIESLFARGEVPFPHYSALLQSSQWTDSLKSVSFCHAHMEKTVEGMRGFMHAFSSQLVQLHCHLSLLESMTTGVPCEYVS